MSIKEYISKTPVGFNGAGFYETVYNSEQYIVQFQKGKIFLFTTEGISEKTTPYNDLFVTELSLDEVTDLTRSKLSAIYNGNSYNVGLVSSHGERLEVIGEYENHERDEALGITYNPEVGFRSKFVNLDEVDDLIISRESIYEKVKAEEAEKKTGLTM